MLLLIHTLVKHLSFVLTVVLVYEIDVCNFKKINYIRISQNYWNIMKNNVKCIILKNYKCLSKL